MACILSGSEGEASVLVGGVPFILDSIWSKYEEAFSRSYALDKAGYSVHRTEAIDENGSISKRGVRTALYLIWIRRGRIEKTRGRKPGRPKGSFGARQKTAKKRSVGKWGKGCRK